MRRVHIHEKARKVVTRWVRVSIVIGVAFTMAAIIMLCFGAMPHAAWFFDRALEAFVEGAASAAEEI